MGRDSRMNGTSPSAPCPDIPALRCRNHRGRAANPLGSRYRNCSHVPQAPTQSSYTPEMFVAAIAVGVLRFCGMLLGVREPGAAGNFERLRSKAIAHGYIGGEMVPGCGRGAADACQRLDRAALRGRRRDRVLKGV